ncbi:hypothetical protein H1C71_005479 [Ictidomys tridecemlineatus]|uniref:putative HTLV-1-related endogenous sequence n=1 Tax=Ictidomys tridecemlineatus TaxID=43179 RepID=UPI001A9E86A4|nr:putative HTLV-1-related endogenous sequence [Ictidomys tridecemlineatus]KAG3278532.1 hypothetical protein H1C71_005479 [Ictidomys tridecemlineatus]
MKREASIKPRAGFRPRRAARVSLCQVTYRAQQPPATEPGLRAPPVPARIPAPPRRAPPDSPPDSRPRSRPGLPPVADTTSPQPARHPDPPTSSRRPTRGRNTQPSAGHRGPKETATCEHASGQRRTKSRVARQRALARWNVAQNYRSQCALRDARPVRYADAREKRTWGKPLEEARGKVRGRARGWNGGSSCRSSRRWSCGNWRTVGGAFGRSLEKISWSLQVSWLLSFQVNFPFYIYKTKSHYLRVLWNFTMFLQIPQQTPSQRLCCYPLQGPSGFNNIFHELQACGRPL